MFKTISAALLAVSVIAAPAFAAGTGKTAQAPVTKSVQAPVIKSTQLKNEQGKNEQSKTGVLNANAKMGRHHYKHARHHRHHKMGALNTHAKVSFKPVTKSHSKVSFKHTAPIAKRG
jgi:hypothetical protein